MSKPAIETPKSEITIEQIRPEHTWQLRRDVLYPGMMKHEMEMPEDTDGIHFGAYVNDKLAGVVSLFQNGSRFQFRKLAVDAAIQKRGIGGTLLNHLISYAAENGGTVLWCNARVEAIPFYLKHGFTAKGEQFSKNGFNYEVMNKTLTPFSDR